MRVTYLNIGICGKASNLQINSRHQCRMIDISAAEAGIIRYATLITGNYPDCGN